MAYRGFESGSRASEPVRDSTRNLRAWLEGFDAQTGSNEGSKAQRPFKGQGFPSSGLIGSSASSPRPHPPRKWGPAQGPRRDPGPRAPERLQGLDGGLDRRSPGGRRARRRSGRGGRADGGGEKESRG
eukprot:5074259-Pyramimonas_sp.AAC.1